METVTKSQLKQWIDRKEDMLLIDVLPEESFQKQHIPTAVNIPLKDNNDFVEEVRQNASSKDQSIVVYCASSQCPLSRQAAQELEDAGFTDVHAFEEGAEGWFGKTTSQAA